MSLSFFYTDLEDTVMNSKMYGSLNATIMSPTIQTMSIQ
jgi:hypothetical protein